MITFAHSGDPCPSFYSLRAVWVMLVPPVVEAVEVIPAVLALGRAQPGKRSGVLPPWPPILQVDVVVEGVAHPLRSLAHCSDPDGPAEELEVGLLCKVKAGGSHFVPVFVGRFLRTHLDELGEVAADCSPGVDDEPADPAVVSEEVDASVVPHGVVQSRRMPVVLFFLVLDNAKYHRTHQTHCPNPLTASKRENIATINALHSKGTRRGKEEVKELTITREGDTHTFQLDDFGKHTRGTKNWKSGGPSLHELRVHTQRVVKKFAPEWLKTELEAFMEGEGHQVIYTPPYLCSFQPIERLWAVSKGAVSTEWRMKRTLPQAFDDLSTVWYGGIGVKTGKIYDGIKADNCERMIKASIEQMDIVIEKFGVRCSGRFGAMQYDSTVPYESGDYDDPDSDEETDDNAVN